jgi:hypothetical protein
MELSLCTFFLDNLCCCRRLVLLVIAKDVGTVPIKLLQYIFLVLVACCLGCWSINLDPLPILGTGFVRVRRRSNNLQNLSLSLLLCESFDFLCQFLYLFL